jgi:hypothetical protein
MSDDGYNGTAPINSRDSFKECRGRSIKKGSISMYDWALRNPYNAIFSLNKQNKATTSTGVRRVIPKGSVARNSSLPPLHIFVGTWLQILFKQFSFNIFFLQEYVVWRILKGIYVG